MEFSVGPEIIITPPGISNFLNKSNNGSKFGMCSKTSKEVITSMLENFEISCSFLICSRVMFGEEEHVSNIVDIKRKLVEQGFVIEKNINQWNLFHITRFRVNEIK